MVYNPSFLWEQKKIWVILRAGQYQEEIKTQLLWINPSILIIE